MPINPNNVNVLNSPSIDTDSKLDGNIDDVDSQDRFGDDFKSELERKRIELRKQNVNRLTGMLDQVSSVLNKDEEQDEEVKDELNTNITNMKRELNFDINSV